MSENRSRVLLFDGAMGTVLQNRGLASSLPAQLNIENEAAVYQTHRAYLSSGVDYITTNTFSINDLKLQGSGYSTEELITAGIKLARQAVADSRQPAKVVLDIGPLGQLLYPVGTLGFEEAYQLFAVQVKAGAQAQCDAILIETISDIYEAKAAVLAAREHSNLPVFCTMTFDKTGRSFSGTDIETMVTVLESLGVSVLGLNCSTGPQTMIKLVRDIASYSSMPILVQPNAGLPQYRNNLTRYDLEPLEYAEYAKQLVEAGASIIGGCCGTTPEYMTACRKVLTGVQPRTIKPKNYTAISSYAQTVTFGQEVKLIGERINPTGKTKLKQALKDNDLTYILKEAIAQQNEGADILDINLGLPGIDQIAWMKQAVYGIQTILDIPLQIDSANVQVLEQAARIYNGKPLINSVNGKAESMKKIFPIVKKYGACVLGLTLDEKGIPSTAEERLAIAQKIIDTAAAYHIPKKNILIDCLVLTASAQQQEVLETLKAVHLVKSRLGVKTVLGISNVSYGLPARDNLNKTFLAMALHAGLDAPILNTAKQEIIDTVAAFKVLSNEDVQAKKYIISYTNKQEHQLKTVKAHQQPLADIVLSGLKEEAIPSAQQALKTHTAEYIINNILIPTLDQVGLQYETEEIFLPQLIQSAETAKLALSLLQDHLQKSSTPKHNHKIILATVKGDIHDIGKNIVKIVLENYGFAIIDLGKDVPPEQVLSTAKDNNARLVGLSALMTTTISSMAETIKLLNEQLPDCQTMVGGAVLNEEYAKMINADYYAADALQAVAVARSVFDSKTF